jgi:sirohydrochlorin ferrochelatase
LLGGIVGWGSNRSTAQEAAAQLAAAEAERKALIDTIELRVVPEQPTLH